MHRPSDGKKREGGTQLQKGRLQESKIDEGKAERIEGDVCHAGWRVTDARSERDAERARGTQRGVNKELNITTAQCA